MKFNHLNVPNQYKHYWTKYPEGYTILEALLNWVNQVDGMVDHVNELDEQVTGFRIELDEFLEQFDTSLRENVIAVLDDWQTSGFLQIIISEALQTEIDYIEQIITTVEKYKHLAVLTAEGLDWAPVLHYLQSQGKTAYLANEVYTLYSSIEGVRRIVGGGRQRSILRQMNTDLPVLKTTGGVYYWTDFKIEHASMPTAQVAPAGAGIQFEGVSDGSVFERLEIAKVTAGMILPDSSGTHIYSSSINDIRITEFTYAAAYIGNTGHTGSVWSNLYAVNWLDYGLGTKREANYGFYFKGINEGVYQQLNVEHGIYHNGIVFNNCANVDATAIHFEGYVPKGNYNAFIYIDGGSTQNVNISGLTLVYNTFNSANFENYALMNVNYSPKIKLSNVRSANNEHIGTFSLRKFFGAGLMKEGASIYADNISIDATDFKDADYFPISPQAPVVKKFGDSIFYWEEGGKKRYLVAAKPTTGKWSKGDKAINLAPTAGGYEGFISTESGYFNPPASTVTATANAFVSDIAVNSYGDFKVGDRLTIVGSTRTFEFTGTYSVDTQKYMQVTPNTEVALSSATVQHAQPVIKGYGLIEA